ncbi:MAG: homoserine dehydrogenase [Osedax symbiont Rs1]|nr:MAG: homoserine dehydrogenase [Osedax symbiont Rs1]
MKPVKIGICGLGTVGSGTFNVLTRNAQEISRRVGCEIIIEQVGARRDHPNCITTGINITRDIFEVAVNPDVDIVVELIGGYEVALKLVMLAIENGKHVVTANKALIAEHGNQIFAAAKKHNVIVAFESAVAGGIPIIKALREGLAANQINGIAGIINGTGNFILTEMQQKGRDFADVLAEAQALGYAEADPTFDVEGIDAAHKLTIMASIAYGIPLQFDKAYTEGIGKVTSEDVKFADELGYRIKHLGIARRTAQGIELRVHPTMIPKQTLLANVNGVMNAVLVDADAVGQTLHYGAGAGDEATASAVIADIIDIARNINSPQAVAVPPLGFQSEQLLNTPILAMDQTETGYYLHIKAAEKPGVLAAVTKILGDYGINIEAIVQKETDQDYVPVILLTQSVVEHKMNQAITTIEALDSTLGVVARIRVEHL